MKKDPLTARQGGLLLLSFSLKKQLILLQNQFHAIRFHSDMAFLFLKKKLYFFFITNFMPSTSMVMVLPVTFTSAPSSPSVFSLPFS